MPSTLEGGYYMNCIIKCSCGCSVSLSEKNIHKISNFSCPACNQPLSLEYIEKIKQCITLMDECKKVKHKNTASNGFVDMTSQFNITFEL